MRPALLVIALLPLTAATAQTAAPSAAAPLKPCDKPLAQKIGQRGPVGASKLGDMPPAKQLLGVYNAIDGCPAPIVVRDSVGLPAR